MGSTARVHLRGQRHLVAAQVDELAKEFRVAVVDLPGVPAGTFGQFLRFLAQRSEKRPDSAARLGHLTKAWGVFYVATAVLFSWVHVRVWPSPVALLWLALGLGWLRWRSPTAWVRTRCSRPPASESWWRAATMNVPRT